MEAKWWWCAGITCYVVPAVLTVVYILANGLDRPLIGGLLWPLRIIKLLFGGG